MPVQLHIDFPEDNEIALSPAFLAQSSGSVTVLGRGNRIVVDAPFLPNAAHFYLTGGATVEVGENSNLNHLRVHALAEGAVIAIGAWASFNGTSQITAHERSAIRIGARCLFGDGCTVASSDVHKVLDAATGARLNLPGDIVLGEHVWAAPRVAILRNASVGADSVVGTGSVVKGVFPANVLLAGAPARVVRTGITWAM